MISKTTTFKVLETVKQVYFYSPLSVRLLEYKYIQRFLFFSGLGLFTGVPPVLNWADYIAPHKGYKNNAIGTSHDQLSVWR